MGLDNNFEVIKEYCGEPVPDLHQTVILKVKPKTVKIKPQGVPQGAYFALSVFLLLVTL